VQLHPTISEMWRPWHDFSDANSVAAQDISEI
jgi:hypothetical protein